MGSILEVKYPNWLANIVMVRKATRGWSLCVDFTNCNAVYPKDNYSLPLIDELIDKRSSYELLSFMDAYSSYNQIRCERKTRRKQHS